MPPPAHKWAVPGKMSMLIKFEHPAIVSGRWENGHPRHDLVRVTTDIEIAEYTRAEAPETFTVIDGKTREALRSVSSVGQRHYKRWDYDSDARWAVTGGELRNHLFMKNGDFRSILFRVDEAVKEIRKTSRYRDVENTERTLLKRQIKAGWSSLGMACLKAPTLKNWKWLDNDTDAQVEHWRGVVRNVMSNIISIDGVPYTRSFEPLYELDCLKRFPRITQYSSYVFTGLPDPEPAPGSRLFHLPSSSLTVGRHYFSPLDLEGAEAIAAETGCRISGPEQVILVHDEDAVGIDHLEMETVRHARMLYDAGIKMREIALSAGGRYCGTEVDMAVMAAETSSLADAIVDWQENRDIDRLSQPFETLFDRVVEWGELQSVKTSYDLVDQINTFRLRQDATPISIPAYGAAGGPP